MRPPPGNSGGAVSGAGPCAGTTQEQNNIISMAASDRPQTKIVFCNDTNLPSSKKSISRHTSSYGQKTTGGEIRLEEGEVWVNSKQEERAIAPEQNERKKHSQAVWQGLA
jgi:hypothetical protein